MGFIYYYSGMRVVVLNMSDELMRNKVWERYKVGEFDSWLFDLFWMPQ